MNRHPVVLAGLLPGVLLLAACAGLADHMQAPFGPAAGAIGAGQVTRAEAHRHPGQPESAQSGSGVKLYRRVVAVSECAVPVFGFSTREAAYCAIMVCSGSDLVESVAFGECGDVSIRSGAGEYTFRGGILYAPGGVSEEVLMRSPAEGRRALVLFPREWVGNASDLDDRRQFAYGSNQSPAVVQYHRCRTHRRGRKSMAWRSAVCSSARQVIGLRLEPPEIQGFSVVSHGEVLPWPHIRDNAHPTE
jgi:hypothetical protein